MRILLVNKFFYVKGGAETYHFALRNLLVKKGHTVIDFSMSHDKNLYSPYAGYFVSKVDYDQRMNVINQLKSAVNLIYNIEAKSKFEALVIDSKPDVIHLNNFYHQISSSILDVAKKYNIPTVFTVHDMKMVCPAYLLYTSDGVCERCKGGKFYHCFLNRCVKNSYSKSIVAPIENYFNRWRRAYEGIDLVITPSKFYFNKLREFGFKHSRMIHLANFLDDEVDNSKRLGQNQQSYYLYFGRLSKEKGLKTLVSAFVKAKKDLLVVGTGPLEDPLRSYLVKHNISHIKLLGFKSGVELKDLIGCAKAVVLPSEWYENSPYSAIESLQQGIPLIGADIGGIPELIKGNGFLFPAKDSEALQRVVSRLESLTPEEYLNFCETSRRIYEENSERENYYRKLMPMYRILIGQEGVK